MEAEDVAAFMMADDDEPAAAAPVARPAPRAKAPKAPAKKAVKRAPAPPPPSAQAAPQHAPPPSRAAPASGPSAQDIRQMLMEEETVQMPSRVVAGGGGGGRFEPLSSEIEIEAVKRTVGGAGGAKGGGFASVLVVGTEERSETMEETARTFVAYRIEAQKEGGGPYIIYRRYKQFEVLHSRCRQHGMKVGKLPERRGGNWFGLKVKRMC